MKSQNNKQTNIIGRIRRYRLTFKGALISCGLDLILAYLFASLAIHTGSLWHWAIAILLFISALVHLTNAVEAHNRRKKGSA